ncbi:hypothetical protein BSKO_12499 [Bryopsis sp. KO-2023]|nr:hypothetical protein BSKO_12499 [Bryopsis sp. KO-2023]
MNNPLFLLQKKNQERLEDWRNVLSSLSRSQSNAKGSAAGPFHRKAIHVAHVDKQNSGDEGVKFTYLEQKELKDLLAVHLGALPDGVLQKFVGQTGEIQTVYLVHWQEVLFRASQLVMNISGNISRDRLPKGPVPVILQTRLQEICDSIVQHVYEVSPQKYRIDSMKLYFKKDHLGGLRLLFCSELRVTKLCDRTSKTIVKIRNYKPVVTPQYFNHSHSVETCTSVIRRGTTQRNVSLGLSPRRTASASVSTSLEIPSTPSEKLANTIGSAIPKGVSAFKLVLKQKRSPTPEAAITSDIQSERIGIGSILRSNGGSPRKLDTSFSKPRIRSADGEIGAKRRESLMTQPAPEPPSTDVRPASAPIRSTTVLSKRTPQTKGKGTPVSKPLDLGSILEEKKKKCRSTSDQVHDLSLMEYHQWLGKSRPQRAIHTKQNAEALPHLLVFEVGEEHKDAVRSQASDNRVPMSKRNEGTVPCSRMHHTYPTADKGVSSQRVSKRKDVSSTYNVKKTPEENADKDGLAEYKEFVRAQYAFFHESEHVHRMKLQMQIAERDITISGLKSDLIEQKAELCDLRRRREK